MADAAAALALRAARPDGAAPSVRAASTPEVPVAGPTPAGPTPPGSAASEPADPVRSTADGRDGADRLLDPAHHLARGIDLLAAGDFAEALTALRTAVALGDGSPVTVLNLAIAEDRAGDVARARAQMRRLAASRPDWDEPVLRLAESLRAGGDMAAAEAAYREVLDRNPRREEALVALSGLLIARGAAEEARVLLLRCCGVNPANAEAWDTLGLALLATEAASLALASFVTAQRLAPDVLDYALHAVEAASLAGELEAELARLEVAVQESPLDAALHTARGVALARLGQRAAAIDAFEVAVALAPEAAMPVALLGGVLAHANRLREAEDALRRAADRDPGNPRLRNDLAAVLMRMHRHAEAREILSALRSEHGDSVPVLCNLANATACVGLQAEAVALAEAAVRLDPEAVLPRRTLCNTLPYAEGVDGTRLLAALRACSARLPRESLPPFHNVPDPERRLVVGLLSGTLRSHPVGWLTVAAFEMLPPAAFELVCLVQNGAAGDPLAQRFRAVAGRWIDIDLLDDVALARCAREQGIDVLIDLGGYGDAGRMPACAHRLAPVQIKWVGMQNHSSGLAEMDWLLTDRFRTVLCGAAAAPARRVCLLQPAALCPRPRAAPGAGARACHLRVLQQPGEGYACNDRGLGGDPLRPAGRSADPEDAPVRGRGDGGAPAGRLRRVGCGCGPAGPARRIGPSRLPARVQRCGYRPRSVPLFRWADHVRGALDGRADRGARRGNLRVAPFRQSFVQCGAGRLGCRQPRGVCGTGDREGARRGGVGSAAQRPA